MKTSELIIELQDLMIKHGDLDVVSLENQNDMIPIIRVFYASWGNQKYIAIWNHAS